MPDNTFVKICGITRLGDARRAAEAGAAAIGYVFAPSPRRISLAKAAWISQRLAPSVRRIGIFVDASAEEISRHVRGAGLDGVQLQGDEPPRLAGELRKSHPDLFICKAVRISRRGGVAGVYAWAADAIMVDSKDPLMPGRASQRIPLSWLKELEVDRLIVAGGLDASNVARVVRQVRPWGVDVSGGVEATPGKKDPAKIEAFVKAVRRAENAAARF